MMRADKFVVSNFPLKLGMGYLLFTFILFYIGPMTWQLPRWWLLSVYVPMLFTVLATFFLVGIRKQPQHARLKGGKIIFYVGALSAILLLYPTAILYTGRAPWQIMEALADQRDAYSMLREQLEATQGVRGPLAIIRSGLAPFIFAVLPLGVIYWKKLSNLMRVLLIATVASTMTLSVLRGTTRELADVVIVGGAAFLVAMYRGSGSGGPSGLLHHWRKIVLGLLLVSGVLAALIGRTEARLADTGIDTCIGGGYVCPAFNSPIYKDLPPSAVSGLATITGYFSQGYYGLGLALDHEFIPTWGVGHSPALESLYRSVTGDDSIWRSTYVSRLDQDAWSSDFHWSTAATWFANDVSFWGVPVVMVLIGLLWGRSWVDAVYGRDDIAAVFFCIMMMMIFYFPANNQVMNTFENYAVTVFWGGFWMLSRTWSFLVRGPAQTA